METALTIANSEDRSLLDLSVPVMDAVYPPPSADVPAPEATSIKIGRDMYALSGNLPDGTFFQWGVNLKVMNETETLAQVAHLADTFQGSRKELVKNVKLKAVEFGNEPNVFGGWTKETAPAGWGDWSPLNYTITWKNLAQKATKIMNLKGDTSLVPGSWVRLASSILGGGPLTPYEWSAGACFEAGLFDDKDVEKATKEWSSHTYSGAFTASVPVHVGTLMDKGNVRANLSSHWDDIRITRSQGLTYYLSETNSYGNHGIPGLSNGGEQVIWGVDYMLQGASMGIARMHFHNGRGFKYNILEPIKLDGTGVDDGVGRQDRPHIMPLYHAVLIVHEAVGKTGKSYVAEVPTQSPQLASYAIFEKNKLVRMVIVNSAVHTGGKRSAFRVALNNIKGKATAKRFYTEFTNSTSGFTWAGQNFDTASGNPEGAIVTEDVQGSVDIEASSVVLLEFK